MKWSYGYISQYDEKKFNKAYAELSPSRKARVDRYKREEDKKRSLLGEMLIKELLSDEYNIESQVLVGEKGEPLLENSTLNISIAHCNDLVVCAISEQEVGIDVEQIKPIFTKLIDRVCVDEEVRFVLSDKSIDCFSEKVEDTDVLRRFFGVWTKKEAWFKKIRTGITDLHSVNTLKLNSESHYIEDYVINIVF